MEHNATDNFILTISNDKELYRFFIAECWERFQTRQWNLKDILEKARNCGYQNVKWFDWELIDETEVARWFEWRYHDHFLRETVLRNVQEELMDYDND